MRLENKVAIITGAASGIGLATAAKFVREGARVVVADIVPARVDQACAELAGGDRVMPCVVDVTDRAQIDAMVAQVLARWGRIDVLLNNAGITKDARLVKMTETQFDQVIGVNLTGVFNCTKAVYPYMENRGWGRIVTAASVVGLYGNFGQSNYAATKGGVIAMTKVWAKEMGRKGITANAVAPGFIHTEMMDTLPENVLKMMQEKAPAGRLGTAEEVAAVYVFLASEEAAFINGATISVVGGLTQ